MTGLFLFTLVFEHIETSIRNAPLPPNFISAPYLPYFGLSSAAIIVGVFFTGLPGSLIIGILSLIVELGLGNRTVNPYWMLTILLAVVANYLGWCVVFKIFKNKSFFNKKALVLAGLYAVFVFLLFGNASILSVFNLLNSFGQNFALYPFDSILGLLSIVGFFATGFPIMILQILFFILTQNSPFSIGEYGLLLFSLVSVVVNYFAWFWIIKFLNRNK